MIAFASAHPQLTMTISCVVILLVLTFAVLFIAATLGQKTTIYVDTSGSISVDSVRTKMIQKLQTINKPFAVLKTFSYDVRTIGYFRHSKIETLFDRCDGPSMLYKIVADFRASGADKAIVVTDGYLHDYAEFANEPGLTFVTVA
jgi:HJR/Mrr/RecB family endonuclease